jgi:(S)-ureidoglycine aminohydrolase
MTKLLLLLLLVGQLVFAQTTAPIVSKVYRWSDLQVVKRPKGEARPILEGITPHFKLFKVHATTINPHSRMRDSEYTQENEELIIVKEGVMTVTVEGKTKELKPGGIALIMSGDKRSLVNNTDKSATYYVFQLNSIAPLDIERGNAAGGSLLLNWDETEFKGHDKGGRRNFFDRPTSMCNRFEMHVTTLTGNWMSHPAHRHPAAEILLLVNSQAGEADSQAQETIDGVWQDSKVGDIIFLNSNISHGLRNTSKGSCTYFAFQFE